MTQNEGGVCEPMYSTEQETQTQVLFLMWLKILQIFVLVRYR